MREIDLIKSKLSDLKCSDTYIYTAIENIEVQLNLLEKLQKTLYSTELYLIYKHTSPDGKVYIGITKNLPNARWNEGAGYETQRKFYKAIQTFGWINFKHEIIAAGLTENEAKKLESKLILEYKSNEDEFGYNTQVLHCVKGDYEEKNEHNDKKRNINNTEIAGELIEKFSIKTINKTIYYLFNGKYISEKETPIIKKELLLTYKIEARKQKEIIEQIKILSYAKREDVFASENNNDTLKKTCCSDISPFFKNLTFEENKGYFISDDELYEHYLEWCEQCNIKTISQNDFIKKSHNYINKYKPEIERIVTSTKIGWEMRLIILEVTSGKIITSRGMKCISNWLENTEEQCVCVPMICEKVLGIKLKGSRKLGNELCFALRNIIPGWECIGVQRTKEYGNQLCFVRK
ncbi:MAG: GIY-YIG nuclease family protein [Clostridia bacterium]|nr:GIY-YIG nuclease family protein [Clostridia bacterium]